jgi:hypothetical protein
MMLRSILYSTLAVLFILPSVALSYGGALQRGGNLNGSSTQTLRWFMQEDTDWLALDILGEGAGTYSYLMNTSDGLSHTTRVDGGTAEAGDIEPLPLAWAPSTAKTVPLNTLITDYGCRTYKNENQINSGLGSTYFTFALWGFNRSDLGFNSRVLIDKVTIGGADGSYGTEQGWDRAWNTGTNTSTMVYLFQNFDPLDAYGYAGDYSWSNGGMLMWELLRVDAENSLTVGVDAEEASHAFTLKFECWVDVQ